jgi:hypothetical protein
LTTTTTEESDDAALIRSNTLQQLSQALAEHREIWISYNGGTTPLIPRPIVPIRWDRPNVLLIASDSHAKPPQEKAFTVSKIVEIRMQSWTIADNNTPTVVITDTTAITPPQSMK